MSKNIFFSAVRFGRVPKREKAKINAAMESSRLKNMENRVMAELADDAKIIETVVRAHFDTCDYTEEKIKPFIAKAKADKQFTQCSGMVSKYSHIINIQHLLLCLNLQSADWFNSIYKSLKLFPLKTGGDDNLHLSDDPRVTHLTSTL